MFRSFMSNVVVILWEMFHNSVWGGVRVCKDADGQTDKLILYMLAAQIPVTINIEFVVIT